MFLLSHLVAATQQLDLLLIYTPRDPPLAALTPGPSVCLVPWWNRCASSRLQAVRMTQIPVNSDVFQAAFPADFKLQQQTQRQQPYRDCRTSSHNYIWSNTHNKLFADYIITYIDTDTDTHIYTNTYISSLEVLPPVSLVELCWHNLKQTCQNVSIC